MSSPADHEGDQDVEIHQMTPTSDTSLLPDNAIRKSEPSLGAATCSNGWQVGAVRVGSSDNCLHQDARLSCFLLELMTTERASRSHWIRRQPQFGDQPQNFGEQRAMSSTSLTSIVLVSSGFH